MTSQGVNELYQYLGAAWPTVIRPGVDEAWKKAKLRELFKTYRDYGDEEVLRAFMKWTEENEKFPTTNAIINELKWAQIRKTTAGRENEERWPMSYLRKDGSEWSWGNYIRSDFLQHPKNPNHLQPEEWERRFLATRRKWYEDHLPPPTPEAKSWAEEVTAFIRKRYEEARESNENLH